MSTSTLKQRHYAALSSRLRSLQSNLAETEREMEHMAGQLQSMARFGVGCGAQFMAVSRILDVELLQQTSGGKNDVDDPQRDQPQAQAQSQSQPHSYSHSQSQSQSQSQTYTQDADMSYASPTGR